MDEELKRFKNKKKNSQKNTFKINNQQSNIFLKIIVKIILVTTLTLITIIVLNKDEKLKTNFYKYVFDTNFSFASVNNFYQKNFGSAIPFNELIKEPTVTVFNEELKYEKASLYKDGVTLSVTDDYLVPIMTSGMVVFIGEKEDYGNTVIIQGMDGIDKWYGNIKNINVNLYDYVKEGELLGEVTDNKLYMVFKKEGNVLNYEDYIK